MKKKVMLIIGAILLAPAIVVAVIISAGLYRFVNPYLDRDIAGLTTLSSNWLEIAPARPLRPERVVQRIVLAVEEPIRADPNTGA